MEQLFGNLKRGLLFVLSAPAGAGKTTLVNKLVKENPFVVRSVSYTTRKRRPNEKDGVDYSFVTKDQFQKKIEEDDFLEFAKIYEDHYGTSKTWVNEKLDSGKHVVLVIDTQGAELVRKKCMATFIFVKPPSLEELKNRLEKRKTETDADIEERLSWAKREIADSQNYDYCLINDQFDVAYQVLKSIFIAELHRIKNLN